MRFLSKLFGRPETVESRLEGTYAQTLANALHVSAQEAQSLARDIVKAAKKKSQEKGTNKLPANFGDILLQRENSDAEVRKMLAVKRQDGVQDSDIRWWWNLDDLERWTLVEVDNCYRYYAYRSERENDAAREQAAAKVRKHWPIYGDPQDSSHTSEDDRPLPHELKHRVGRWIERAAKTDPEGLKKLLEKHTSFNALVRAQLRTGHL